MTRAAAHQSDDGRVSVGERIHLARRRKSIDAKDLAEMIGVHRNTLGRWEKGDGEPSLTQGLAIASVLGVSPDDLAFGADTLPAWGDKPLLTGIEGGRRATDPPRSQPSLPFLSAV